MRNTLQSVWQTQKPFNIRSLGHNKFQFIFNSEGDKQRVFTGKTWSFDGQYLLLREWSPTCEEHKEEDDIIQLWVQIWDLPIHWVSAEIGLKVGKLFHNVIDVVVPDMGVYGGRLIKILVELNLKDPILRGTHIRLGGEARWVHFKYENLLNFCYYCGRIGHADRNCALKKEDVKKNSLNTGQFGEWLRASVFGYMGGRSPNKSGKNEWENSTEGQMRLSSRPAPSTEDREHTPDHSKRVGMESSESDVRSRSLENVDKFVEHQKNGSPGSEDGSVGVSPHKMGSSSGMGNENMVSGVMDCRVAISAISAISIAPT
ncbi:Unknown protein [Striga hermonthica]|uniref:CCHC-type domain-containing protein n=1 Tax=Striga hermonthica TaxID=68872 RepID=A0A9N7REK5_STRHE|nr:Unknown protein [Striga hermonthica]